MHYTFRSGDLLVWLAADPDLAQNALKQALQIYP
jgi:hypothetical protein